MKVNIKEIKCKSALNICGFEANSFCINPYRGCQHNCQYCYARFVKRFTGIKEAWGSFVHVKINIEEVLRKQLKSDKYKGKIIFIGTVTDPYQPAEKKYKLTRYILATLLNYQNPVEILTKSDLVLRDLDLIKRFKEICVNFTVNTLDEKWKKLVEPNSSSVEERLEAARKLNSEGIKITFMLGPYWPFFTEPEALFKEFKKAGASHVFSESFNTIGGNWVGVDRVLRKNYPELYREMSEIILDKEKFNKFYAEAEKKMQDLSKKYKIPITLFYARGHAKNK